MQNEKSSAFFYETQQKAEEAIGKLEGKGFDMKLVSLVLADFSNCTTITGYYTIESKITKMGSTGGFSGMANQSAFFMIPGIGPLLITGAFVSVFLAALNDNPTKSFPKILNSALLAQGIALDETQEHGNAIIGGKFILVVQAARTTLRQTAEQYLWKNRETIVLSGGERSPFQ